MVCDEEGWRTDEARQLKGKGESCYQGSGRSKGSVKVQEVIRAKGSIQLNLQYKPGKGITPKKRESVAVAVGG